MASIDFSDLDMNAIQQASRQEMTDNPNGRVIPRRVSWDDFTLFHQTVSEWGQPVVPHPNNPNTYKSQNPSPKYESQFDGHRDISPLSVDMMNQHIGFEQESETEDMDTTSASTVSPRVVDNTNGKRPGHKQGAARDSMEDIMDTSDDYAEPQSSFRDPSLEHDVLHDCSDNEAKINELAMRFVGQDVSTAAGDGDDEGDDDDDDHDDDAKVSADYDHNKKNKKKKKKKKDVRLIVMELQLNDMNDKVFNLMQIIRELKEKNEYLEQSKIRLATSTALAMNDYKQSMKRLTRHNQMLQSKLNRQ